MGAGIRVGVIDVGSNTAHLAMFDLRLDKPLKAAGTVKEPTLLGEAIRTDGALDRQAVRRLVSAVCDAVRTARRSGVDELISFATSAVRDAANAEEVVKAVERKCGLRLGFLDGQAEARLTFTAARAWYGWSAGPLFLADIGGGSLEIAYGTGIKPQIAESVPLGAGRLTRSHLPGDPPRGKDVRDLRRMVADQVRELAQRLDLDHKQLGQAVGTSRTLAQLAKLTGRPTRLERRNLERHTDRLSDMKIRHRVRLPGVSQPRARQILAGAIVAEAVLDAFSLDGLDICPWAIREGVALERLTGLATGHDSPEIAHLIQRVQRARRAKSRFGLHAMS